MAPPEGHQHLAVLKAKIKIIKKTDSGRNQHRQRSFIIDKQISKKSQSVISESLNCRWVGEDNLSGPPVVEFGEMKG
jgi:hypothetical protein